MTIRLCCRHATLPPLALTIAAVATLVLCTTVKAQNTSQTTYRFQDYPILTVYRGKVRFPDFRRRDNRFSSFRTRIIDGMRDGANFAGKYSVIKIGCGTGCRFYYVGDVTNGHLTAFPYGGEDYGHLDLFYKLNSSLIISVWDESPEACFQEEFEIKNGALTSLGRSSVRRNEGEYCPEPQSVARERSSAASEDRIIEGRIAHYECGDNCYLTIIDKNNKEHTALCTARECQSWNLQSEMPSFFIGKRVAVTVGKGVAVYGDAENNRTMDAYTLIRFLGLDGR
jgi:hypothetical protein